ncbi:hypothetical protein FOZ62_012118 [Perkinsus olseni]|uniref:Uncharacterized protein n=1 Tax=Perkinsus olseni TaxID=32597 RepID=A0A7J6NGJ5_PEROL|nr:hypothetical protein FOZ62_012118 [Perkinsus olseni]
MIMHCIIIWCTHRECWDLPQVAGKVEEVVQSLRISSVAVPTVWPTQQRHAYSIGGTVGVKCKLVQGVVIAKQLDGRLRPLEDILKELAK